MLRKAEAMATVKNHFTKCWQCVKNTAEAVTSKAEYSIYDHTMEFGTRTQKLSQTTITKPHLFSPEVNLHGRHTPTRTTSPCPGHRFCFVFFQGLQTVLLFFLLQRDNFWLQRSVKGSLPLGFCLLLLSTQILVVFFTDPGSLSVQPTLVFPSVWGKASCQKQY